MQPLKPGVGTLHNGYLPTAQHSTASRASQFFASCCRGKAVQLSDAALRLQPLSATAKGGSQPGHVRYFAGLQDLCVLVVAVLGNLLSWSGQIWSSLWETMLQCHNHETGGRIDREHFGQYCSTPYVVIVDKKEPSRGVAAGHVSRDIQS